MPTDHTHPSQFTQPEFRSVNVEYAVEFGMTEAFLIQFFSRRIAWREKKGYKKIQGKTWVRLNHMQLLKALPFLTEHKIRRALDHLVERKVLQQECFNYNPYDRTSWYTLLIKAPQPKIIDMAQPENEEPKEEIACDQSAISTPVENPNSTILKSAKCKDIYSYNIYNKAAAVEKPQSREPSGDEYRSVAAASLVKKKPGLETKVYPCLEPLEVPLSEKQYLAKRYSQALVDEAVAWVTSPGVVIKKSIIAALKWFCTLPPAERPKPQENPETMVEKHRNMSRAIEDRIQSPYASFGAYKEAVVFQPFGNSEGFEIRYDNQNFVDLVSHEMVKRGFERVG